MEGGMIWLGIMIAIMVVAALIVGLGTILRRRRRSLDR
jgi:hypothetical protein